MSAPRQTYEAKPLRGGLSLSTPKPDVAIPPIEILYQPKNNLQRQLRVVWPKAKVIFMTGGPGTGKTAGAIGEALLDLFGRNLTCRRIYITRSPVPKGRSLGFDPGTLDEKLMSWTEQFNDAMEGFTNGTISKLKDSVFRVDAARLQGRTIRDGVLIVDEASDFEFDSLKNICTRVGRNGKIIICGDPAQTNLHHHQENPFVRMMRYQEATPGVSILKADVVKDQLREGFIVEFLAACELGEFQDNIEPEYT